jgi:hypothetical protein
MPGNRRERAQPLASAASSSHREVAQHERPHAGLAAELAALPDLSRDTLKERWKELYGAPPPSHLGRPSLVRAIAYRIQEQALGGLDAATRRLLDRAAKDLARGREPSVPPQPVPSGTRLLREWQGVVHEVVVLDRGAQYREKTWPSLSSVAREITGARWSGPLFFGLKGRKQSGR